METFEKNNKKKTLIIIPARSGSKRIPNKNIKLLNKKPLIYYTIKYAIMEKIKARIIVSTDSKKIANIAIKCGAEVPFLRPKLISTDQTLDFPVINHCLDYLDNVEKFIPEFLVYLRPTQPFRIKGEIKKTINILKKNIKIDTVRTIQKSKYPPFWIKKIDKKNNLIPLEKKYQKLADQRSQNLPTTFFCDGAIDASRVKSYRVNKSFSKGKVYGMLKKNLNYIDIDNIDDWHYAEYIMKNYDKKK